MTYLAVGLALFVGGHLLPALPGLKPRLVDKLGANGVKSVVSLMALAGLVLVAMGWGDAPLDAVRAPGPGARHMALTLVPIAFVLIIAAYVPSRIGWFVGHPMSASIVLWATAHLLANSELRSVVLFGTVGAWGALAWVLAGLRDGWRPKPRPERPWDGVVLLVGLGAAVMMMMAHTRLMGVPALP